MIDPHTEVFDHNDGKYKGRKTKAGKCNPVKGRGKPMIGKSVSGDHHYHKRSKAKQQHGPQPGFPFGINGQGPDDSKSEKGVNKPSDQHCCNKK
jgi:hypothetical protein